MQDVLTPSTIYFYSSNCVPIDDPWTLQTLMKLHNKLLRVIRAERRSLLGSCSFNDNVGSDTPWRLTETIQPYTSSDTFENKVCIWMMVINLSQPGYHTLYCSHLKAGDKSCPGSFFFCSCPHLCSLSNFFTEGQAEADKNKQKFTVTYFSREKKCLAKIWLVEIKNELWTCRHNIIYDIWQRIKRGKKMSVWCKRKEEWKNECWVHSALMSTESQLGE